MDSDALLDTCLSSLRPRARMRFDLFLLFFLLDVSFLRCLRVRILMCSWLYYSTQIFSSLHVIRVRLDDVCKISRYIINAYVRP